MPRRIAAEQSRLRAIWTLLRWQRSVSNAEVRAVTGLETVQASRMLSGMSERHPEALSLDRSTKSWALTDLGMAKQLGGDLDEYLVAARAASLDEGWIHDARPSFLAPHEADISLIRHACLKQAGIDVSYASLTSPGERRRVLFPRALIRTAARWHVRAWCTARQEYRDFNLGRMSKMKLSTLETPDLPEDAQWENFLNLRIVAHPDLGPEMAHALRKEYFGGTVARRISVRQALAPYLLQDLRVAVDPSVQRPPDFLLTLAEPMKGVVFSM